jgi:hypothetical protein
MTPGLTGIRCANLARSKPGIAKTDNEYAKACLLAAANLSRPGFVGGYDALASGMIIV